MNNQELQVKIIVQGNNEPGEDFGNRIADFCNANRITAKTYSHYNMPLLNDFVPRIDFMTTASDGRQTATIQFFKPTKNNQ